MQYFTHASVLVLATFFGLILRVQAQAPGVCPHTGSACDTTPGGSWIIPIDSKKFCSEGLFTDTKGHTTPFILALCANDTQQTSQEQYIQINFSSSMQPGIANVNVTCDTPLSWNFNVTQPEDKTSIELLCDSSKDIGVFPYGNICNIAPGGFWTIPVQNREFCQQAVVIDSQGSTVALNTNGLCKPQHSGNIEQQNFQLHINSSTPLGNYTVKLYCAGPNTGDPLTYNFNVVYSDDVTAVNRFCPVPSNSDAGTSTTSSATASSSSAPPTTTSAQAGDGSQTSSLSSTSSQSQTISSATYCSTCSPTSPVPSTSAPTEPSVPPVGFTSSSLTASSKTSTACSCCSPTTYSTASRRRI